MLIYFYMSVYTNVYMWPHACVRGIYTHIYASLTNYYTGVVFWKTTPALWQTIANWRVNMYPALSQQYGPLHMIPACFQIYDKTPYTAPTLGPDKWPNPIRAPVQMFLRFASDAWDLPGLASSAIQVWQPHPRPVPAGVLASTSFQGTLQPSVPGWLQSDAPRNPWPHTFRFSGACGPDVFQEVSLANRSPPPQ